MHNLEKKYSFPAVILVVDDEGAIKAMMQKSIENAGYLCLAAQSGREAMDLLNRRQIDVVITDIKMPGINGIELTRHIKKNYTSDVIIMTGYVEDFRYEDIINLGASDFLQKPISIKELVVRLKRVLRERRILEERNRAEMELKTGLQRIHKAFSGIIEAMQHAIEHRDPYTAGHQRKVANLALAIARELRMPEERIEGLRMAGLIHDLGKISIPSEILSKPRKLSKLEFGIMQTHPQVAYDILKPIEFPWSVAEIIFQHHERLNGSGYPRGIIGESILQEAKILAVADVVEAMASHRPYRPSIGIRYALNEVEKNKNELYDLEVVETCLALFREKGYELVE